MLIFLLWPWNNLHQKLATFSHGLEKQTGEVLCNSLENCGSLTVNKQSQILLFFTLNLRWPSSKVNPLFPWPRQTYWRSLVRLSAELWFSIFISLTFDLCDDLDLEVTFTKSWWLFPMPDEVLCDSLQNCYPQTVNRQTDRHINKPNQKHNLLGKCNNNKNKSRWCLNLCWY